MATRYTPDELLRLRESPLVVKPPGLPPAEQWMGPPQDSTRTTKTTDRAKNHDSNPILHQANRRPQHISRNSANPEDIILGPPKTSFMSSTARRNDKAPDTDHPLRDADSRDRFNFRNKTADGENERLRDGRNNTLRPKRAEGEQDSDGWSTVKPRKSFGTEGAERFNGRMGVDRHREDRRFKDREDRDIKDRPARGFENFSREARDKDVDHDLSKDNRRNGVGRGRNESWFRGDNDGLTPAPRDRNSNGEKFGNRGWREKNNEEQDRGNRNDRDRGDRRWDRNDRHEPEPAWMDEPAEEKSQAHTQEDFQKWKEAQQNKDRGGKTPAEEAPNPESGGGFFGLDKPKIEAPLAIDTGPDKFFGMWATIKDENGPESTIESKKEGSFFPTKTKSSGKASRFTSFFTPAQEELPQRQTEPPPPMPASAGLAALFQNSGQGSGDSSEKEAFQQLLQKLQRQTVSSSGSTPPATVMQQPNPPPEKQQSQLNPSSDQFQQYRFERQEERRPSASTRNSQQALQDLLSQRQVAGSQPAIRPEQMLQELVGQRQNALSQASVRSDQPQNRNNTDFLMNLMKGQPEPQRSEQILLRMPGTKPVDRQMDRQMQQQQMIEREQEMQREAAARERSASQRQARPPPGFFDDSFQHRGPPPQHDRPPQPTQILQRPPPPGLDQMQPGWAPPSQMPPQQLRQQQQHIAPPPGLAGRGMPPMPQQMFPPGFPGMGNFPPPEVMAGPRGMPPPGFFQGPPPGFMPPGFQGPEGIAFDGPFDGRGPPPNGAFRRQ